jgi:hypothetical protein
MKDAPHPSKERPSDPVREGTGRRGPAPEARPAPRDDMKLMSAPGLLAEAPLGSHFVQLHPSSESLAGDFAQFVISGIRRSERVLMIALPSHVKSVLDKLQRLYYEPAVLQWSGQLAVLDAQWTLGQIMHGDQPSWSAFRRVVESGFTRGREVYPKGSRAYSELVNILWQRGNFSGAMELERYWGRLVLEHGFPLLCSYLLDPWKPACYDTPLKDIGRMHHGVVPSGEDKRFRAAVEAASAEILGEAFFKTGRGSQAMERGGEDGLPEGYNRILHLNRVMPQSCGRVLDRAREIYADAAPRPSSEKIGN